MNIALIGYGAMGREIDSLAPSENCVVVARYTEEAPLEQNDACNWDVAIDFSSAAAVVHNATIVTRAGRGLVIGTTGWQDQVKHVQQLVEMAGTGCVVGSNFSVGVQIFVRLARAAGMLINHVPAYDVAVHEWHHTRKADSPSGTALTLGNTLLEEVERKKRLVTETQHERIDPEALHVSSTRVGNVHGKHVITIDGTDDRIELTHDARTRSGFARGALLAAKWVRGRHGFYDFVDVFPQVIE